MCRKDNGALHFYVNGVDQGLASVDVPSTVFGVVDLYGQAAQVTIMEAPSTGEGEFSSFSLKFFV